jgi:hypothetical protein
MRASLQQRCDHLEVGSQAWLDCIQTGATGGVCPGLPVGSPAWRECVQDAATGGGLMPWIVIIPLAVMLVGMALMFGRQWMGRGKPRDPIAVGGNWLLFMVLIEGSIAAGLTYAAIRSPLPGGGFMIAAIALWVTTAVMLVIGLAMRSRAGKRARVLQQGLAGTATIRNMTQTGMFINNNPVVEFEADIDAGMGVYPATFRATVPLIRIGQLAVGAQLPVRVDPQDPNAIYLA